MHIADLLSRNYNTENYVNEYDTVGTVHCINRYNSNNTICDLKKLTEENQVLNQVIEYCKNGWPPSIKKLTGEARFYYNQKNYTNLLLLKGCDTRQTTSCCGVRGSC